MPEPTPTTRANPKAGRQALRVLVVHNILWAHYKGAVFGQMQQLAQQSGAVELRVVHIATTERSRLHLGQPDPAEHQYPFRVLFEGAIESVGIVARTRALLAEVRQFAPQVVNLTGYADPATLAVLAYCRLRGIRTVLSNESNAFDHPRRGWREVLKRWIVGQFDGYFCFGTPSEKYLFALGARPEQILTNRAAVVNDRVIRAVYEAALPLRPARLSQQGYAPHNLVYVGRLHPTKNLNRLLEAFALAQRTQPQPPTWGLLLLGEGDQKAELQKQASDLNLQHVHFLPGVSWRTVPEKLILADALILPSYSEPWGLVVNEAMVCGLPVLVSEHCGCVPDLVIEGQTGYRFDPLEVPQLAQTIQRLMNTPADERRALGQTARQRVADFSLEKVAAQMLAGFQRLANA